jgi:ABC-2 type transport system permease protein
VIALLMGELLKLRTTRMVYGMLGGLLLIVAIATVASILEGSASELELEDNQGDLFGTAATGVIFLLLLGVMILSGEFRHGTITQTLLITPDRWKVLGAKLIAGGLLGLAFGVVAELFALVLGVPLLEARGVDFVFGDTGKSFVIGTLLATTACGMLGVAVGSVLRNQVVAIIVVFVALLLVEPILTASTEGRWPELGKYLPGHAISGVIEDAEDTHGRWGSLALLGAYVLVLASAGGRFVFSRDVNSIQA